ncbi:MAG: hypothetical protein ABI343_09630 [Burkholderiaceae bacterium]
MKFTRKLTVTAALAAALLGGCSSMSMSMPDQPAMMTGGMLTGPNGMTLYTFDRDPVAGGKSVCNGPCANNWPPLMAKATDKPMGDYTIITRDDGSKQWALKGKPLYYWSKDSKAGDKTGDGVANNAWHIVR